MMVYVCVHLIDSEKPCLSWTFILRRESSLARSQRSKLPTNDLSKNSRKPQLYDTYHFSQLSRLKQAKQEQPVTRRSKPDRFFILAVYVWPVSILVVIEQKWETVTQEKMKKGLRAKDKNKGEGTESNCETHLETVIMSMQVRR